MFSYQANSLNEQLLSGKRMRSIRHGLYFFTNVRQFILLYVNVCFQVFDNLKKSGKE